jgi:hypothetical protein
MDPFVLVGGWAYPSETYEIQWEGLSDPIHDMENKKMFDTTNQWLLTNHH